MSLISKINDGFTTLTQLVKLNSRAIDKRVRVDATQALSSAEQAQARQNIGVSATQVSGIVPIDSGGTGANTTTQARSNLGLGTSSTYNVGESNGQVVLNNSVITSTDLNIKGNASFGLPYGKYVYNMWFPSSLNMSENLFFDYQDEFAYANRRKNSVVTATTPNSGNYTALFSDGASALDFTDVNATTVIIELDISQQPVQANGNGYYRVGITKRTGVWNGDCLIEVWDNTASAYVTFFDGVMTQGIAGSFIMPNVALSPVNSGYMIYKMRVTLRSVAITASVPLRIQRLILYHGTSNWDNFRLSRSGGEMYGTITPVVASGANALNVVDSSRTTLAYIRGDGTASFANMPWVKAGVASYKKGWRKLTAILPSTTGEITLAHGVTTVETVQAKVTNTDGIVVYNNDFDPANQFYVRVNGANLILGVTANSSKVFGKTVTIYVGEEL